MGTIYNPGVFLAAHIKSITIKAMSIKDVAFFYLLSTAGQPIYHYERRYTMQSITPTIKLHTTSQDQGTYLNCLIIEHQGNHYHLHGCTGTSIHTFTESICLYVLSINRALCAIGLYAFMAPEPDCINSVSLNNYKEIKEMLGPRWEIMKPEVIVKALITYLN